MPGRSTAAELFAGLRERFDERLRIVRLLRVGGTAMLTGGLLVQITAGVLPAGFSVAVAQVVAAVPGAVRSGLESSPGHRLQTALLVAALLFAGIQLLQPVQEFLGEQIGRRIDDHIRDGMLAVSFGAPGIAAFEDPEVLDHATDALNQLRTARWTPGFAGAGQLALVSRYLQAVSAAVLVGVVFSWWAAAGLLAAALTIRFGYRLGLTAFGQVFRTLGRARRRTGYFRELMLGTRAAKELRIFGLLPWVQARYTEAAIAACTPVWEARRRFFYRPYIGYTLVAVLLLGGVMAAAARAGANGLLGIAGFVLVAQAGMSAMRIGGYIAEADIQTEYGIIADRAVRRFAGLIGAGPDAVAASDVAGADPAGLPVREIRFHAVSFAYPGGPPVLDELELTIEAGSSLAVVGLNGAGKTTLVKLLARLYEPTSGHITADGVDIRRFPVRLWQRRVAAIFQDFVRFELPVRDNVGFGCVELYADEARGAAAMRDAITRAGAAELVHRLPNGVDTPLSRQYAGGADLSGGEWQRIAIARTLMAVAGGAGILVLDEPTASLDVRAEVAFFDQFLELTRKVTSVVISHRFSTVRRADRIVVLEHGRVLEEGTHAELLAAEGRYAQLFRLQAARFHDDDGPVPVPVRHA